MRITSNIVASPIAADGIVYAGSNYERKVFLSIGIDGAKGDLSDTSRVLWKRDRGTPYVPSPLLYDGALYFIAQYRPILTRVDSRTGDDRPGQIRLDGLSDVFSSPVGADGRVYITDLTGSTIVLSSSDAPKVLSLNRLNEPVTASGAIVGRQLLLRGERNLYCLEEPTP